MSQKETVQIDHLTNEQRANYVKTLYVGHREIVKLEKGGRIEIEFDMGQERITTITDNDFFRAAKGGIFGAYRELCQDGQENLANITLLAARKTKI